MNALLPALNSPTTTSRNSSSSWRTERRRPLSLGGRVEAREHRLQLGEQRALVGQQALLPRVEEASVHGPATARPPRRRGRGRSKPPSKRPSFAFSTTPARRPACRSRRACAPRAASERPCVRREPEHLVRDAIGQPLMMEARRVDRLLDVHPEVDDVQDRLQHGVDDRAAARAARSTRNSLPSFARIVGVMLESMRLPGARVRLGADQALGVGDPGAGVEVAHLVVQQEPAPGTRSASRSRFERVGERDRVPSSSTTEKCVVSALSRRPDERRRRGRGPGRADGPAQRGRWVLRGRAADRRSSG